MLPLPSYRLPSKTKRGEHCSPRSISRRGKKIYVQSQWFTIWSQKPWWDTEWARPSPQGKFLQNCFQRWCSLLLHPGDLGLWDSHQIKAQSSNISELWNRTDRNPSPTGTLGVEVGENFYSVSPTEFLFCEQFSVFFPLTTKDSNTCSLEGKLWQI